MSLVGIKPNSHIFRIKVQKYLAMPEPWPNKSDLIITCVTNFESLKEILFQNNGVMKCSNKKTNHCGFRQPSILINLWTVQIS